MLWSKTNPRKLKKSKIFYMKINIQSTLILFIILLIIGIGGFSFYTWDNNKPVSSISISEKSTTKITPNSARVEIQIIGKGIDIGKIKSENDVKSQKLVDFFVQNGINKDKVVTNSSSYPDYIPDYNPIDKSASQPPAEGISRSVVINNVSVLFENFQNDTKKPVELLNKAISLGATSFSPLQYEFAGLSEICSKLKSEAEKKVTETAKNKVKEYNGRLVKIDILPQSDSMDCNQNNNHPIGYGNPGKSMVPGPEGVGSGQFDALGGEKDISVVANAKVEYKI